MWIDFSPVWESRSLGGSMPGHGHLEGRVTHCPLTQCPPYRMVHTVILITTQIFVTSFLSSFLAHVSLQWNGFPDSLAHSILPTSWSESWWEDRVPFLSTQGLSTTQGLFLLRAFHSVLTEKSVTGPAAGCLALGEKWEVQLWEWPGLVEDGFFFRREGENNGLAHRMTLWTEYRHYRK